MDPRISEAEIIDALKRSGYLIESRLINILSDHHYYTFPNEAYPDPFTGKSREIDIYANADRAVNNLTLKNRHLMIETNHSLVIECSNNPQPAIFFKRTEKKKFTIFGKYRFNMHEQDTVEGDSMLHDFFMYTTNSKKFHYNKTDRCSQYCSFTLKKNSPNRTEWLASHPDGLNETFNKIHDFIQIKSNSLEEWIKSTKKSAHYLSMFYPVVVLQGEIYECFEEAGEIHLEKTNHVIFEFNRYEESSSSILIDIITEDYFSEYLKLLINNTKQLQRISIKHYTKKTLKGPR